MEGCETGILVDLSDPTPSPKVTSQNLSEWASPTLSGSPTKHEDEENGDVNKENNPLFDSIEMERSETCRGDKDVVCPQTPQNLFNKALRDATNTHLPRSPVVKLIEDETFDFDFALSPLSVRSKDVSSLEDRMVEVEEEDEEEVFIGPIGFTEKCVSVVVQEEACRIKPMSPLSADQFAEIVKEANLVAYRIGKDTTEEENKENVASKSCKALKFSSASSESGNDDVFSPSKQKHTRGQTYTLSKMLSEVLPENIKVPVIKCEKGSKSETAPVVPKDSEEVSEKSNKENCRSRLAVPRASKLPGSKLSRDRSKSKLPKYGSMEKLNAINGEASSGIDTDDTCSIASDISDACSTSSTSKLPTKKSGIAKPSGKKPSGLKKPSKLQPPKTSLANRSFNSSNESLNSAPIQDKKLQSSTSKPIRDTPSNRGVEVTENSDKKGVAQQKSAIPAIKGPLARKSLLQPSSLQKPKFGAGRGKATNSNVPMKATAAVEKQMDVKCTAQPPDLEGTAGKTEAETTEPRKKSEEVPTPVKQEKRLQPKLLSEKFTTPVRSSSTSSCTPSSARRRSFLPTPNKTRPSSLSSLPPPSPLTLNGSTSGSISQRTGSQGSFMDSPSLNMSQRQLRQGSTSSVSSQTSRKSSVNSMVESPVPSQRKSTRKSISGIAANGASPTTVKTKGEANNDLQKAKIPTSAEHAKPAQKGSIKMVASTAIKAKMYGRRSHPVYKTIPE